MHRTFIEAVRMRDVEILADKDFFLLVELLKASIKCPHPKGITPVIEQTQHFVGAEAKRIFGIMLIVDEATT